MRDNNISEQVEKALNSLDGVRRAGPGPFFFTRLQARLQKRATGAWERAASFITRPAITLGGLCIILLLNALAFYFRPASGTGTLAQATVADAGYAEDDGGLANNLFYDENPEP